MTEKHDSGSDWIRSQAILWSILLVVMAGVVGAMCAGFLVSMQWVTEQRFAHPWLVWFLPVAGLLSIGIYRVWGVDLRRGTPLLLEEIHQPNARVSWRLAPMIWLTTLLTHVCGGSAGREGTAVQMGGAMASFFASRVKFSPSMRRVMMMAGVAAGFGGVFGTPVAGAVFALEVIAFRRVAIWYAVPILLAAFVSNSVCHALGAVHLPYPVLTTLGALTGAMLGKMALAALVFGLVGWSFAAATHRLSAVVKRKISHEWLRPIIGAAVVLGLMSLLGTREFLGLGVWSPEAGDRVIRTFFEVGEQQPWAWAMKWVFTVATLSVGFRGGEVTPLFFIGAALGCALAGVLGLPVDLLAGLGFVAVFGAAAKTPLASAILGMEVFGFHYAPLLLPVCYLACWCSGRATIYAHAVPHDGA